MRTLLSSVNATTGFWDSQVEHDSPQTVIAEIVLDASSAMNEPIAPSQGRMETKWSAARQAVLSYMARQYASPNTYVAFRYFAGPCPTSPLDSAQFPVVDWPDTRYLIGPWPAIATATATSTPAPAATRTPPPAVTATASPSATATATLGVTPRQTP